MLLITNPGYMYMYIHTHVGAFTYYPWMRQSGKLNIKAASKQWNNWYVK